MISEQTGFVIAKGDKEKFLSSLNKIKHVSKDFYHENCRRHAVDLYDKEERYKEYVNLYYDLLNNDL